MLDFKVKSIIHDYEVFFIDDSSGCLKREVEDGDVIIIDKKIKELYPTLTNNLSGNISVITVEAQEKHKSYEGLIPIINQLISNENTIYPSIF